MDWTKSPVESGISGLWDFPQTVERSMGRVRVIRDISDIQSSVRAWVCDGKRIGLVPTMGALHAGHTSLIQRARSENDLVVTTIFVNPTQFAPHEDLAAYPRPFDRDLSICEEHGVDVVYAPTEEAIYPEGFCTKVRVAGLSDRMEGTARPGHFEGVSTVVAKLFHIVPADRAYFGQKDAQQVQVIRRMVGDLNMPIEIVVCPIVRDHDGLALSSRNQYLSSAERKSALVLSQSLVLAQKLITDGESDCRAIRGAMHDLFAADDRVALEYAELVQAETFELASEVLDPLLAVVAATVGKARLIDNQPMEL